MNQTLETKYVINRFPIMATYGYVIAKMKGYNEELSQALGYGVATGYAILKNVGLSLKTITPFNYRSEATKKQKPTLEDQIFVKEDEDFNDYEYIELGGIEFIKHKRENKLRGIRRIRGKQQPFTAEDFKRKVIDKLNNVKPNGFEFLVEIIKRDVEKKGFDLNNLRQWEYYNFWKEKRDVWRSSGIWTN